MTTQPTLPSLTLPAALEIARGALAAANAALAAAPADPAAAAAAAATAQQAYAAAHAAADAAIRPVIIRLLDHHRVTVSFHQLSVLVDAAHETTFAQLAQLAGEYLAWSHPLVIGMRHAYRRHHGRPTHATGILNAADMEVFRRVVACTTFGAAAFILDDELDVRDEDFMNARSFYIVLNERQHPAESTV
jgi:hypothetical protein